MKIVLLVRYLGIGGTERQISLLARGLQNGGRAEVVCLVFYGGGELEHELVQDGIRVVNLEKSSRGDIARFLRRLRAILREEQPQVLYSFLDGANVVAAWVRRSVPGMAVAWGIRSTEPELGAPWPTRVALRLESRLGRWADVIICNSSSGRLSASKRGLPADRLVVVPNGCDVGRFRRNPELRSSIRESWGVSDAEIVIGRVGRIHQMKGWDTFLEAAAVLSRTRVGVSFACMASGSTKERADLRERSEFLGLSSRLHWESPSEEPIGFYSALDIATSSSRFGEGFPNVLSEAMACGVPCVTTDVGDSKVVIGSEGVVVEPDSSSSLVEGWQTMLGRVSREGPVLGAQARDRIVREFSQEILVERTLDALRTSINAPAK